MEADVFGFVALRHRDGLRVSCFQSETIFAAFVFGDFDLPGMAFLSIRFPRPGEAIPRLCRAARLGGGTSASERTPVSGATLASLHSA